MNETPTTKGTTMNDTDKNKISEIIIKTIIRNIQNGMSVEKAKKATFNRMNKECPEVLAAYLN
jgi:hypothetical protein